MSERNMTMDELLGVLAQVDAEIPQPVGWFDSSDKEDAWQLRRDLRIIELVREFKARKVAEPQTTNPEKP